MHGPVLDCGSLGAQTLQVGAGTGDKHAHKTLAMRAPATLGR